MTGIPLQIENNAMTADSVQEARRTEHSAPMPMPMNVMREEVPVFPKVQMDAAHSVGGRYAGIPFLTVMKTVTREADALRSLPANP